MFKKPNTVPTPDEFFDIAVKECTGSEIKLLAVVINKTFRWGKLWDFISLSQFEEETDLNRDTVIKGLRNLEANDWIESSYICSNCGCIIDSIITGKKTKKGKWLIKPSNRCLNCDSTEMPNKWYAAKIDGENILSHLRNIYDKNNKHFIDASPGVVVEKIDYGWSEKSTMGVVGKSDIQETTISQETTLQETGVIPIIDDINNTPGPFADFSKKQKNHDIERKTKFSTFRKQLKGDKLQAFELVADNLEKVIGKTLLEFVEQSPETVRSAYNEMVQRGKKHFSYFTKVFFSHLKQGKIEISPEKRKELDELKAELLEEYDEREQREYGRINQR